MPGPEWACLRASVKCRLRRGAWYRVLRLSAREAVLDVARTPLSVPRSVLQFSLVPPSRWSVVLDARLPEDLPDSVRIYAVCPSCRSRASLGGRPASLRCPRCNALFEVAWRDADTTAKRGEESHPEAGSGVPTPPHERRRVAERRFLGQRRSRLDRRIDHRRRSSLADGRGRRVRADRRSKPDRRRRVDRRSRVRP